jgi:hypothetical protein
MNPNDTAFFSAFLGTIFVFLYIGFFPLIISFTASYFFRRYIKVVKEKPVINDVAFIAVFLLSVVSVFFVYQHFGMLAA